MAVDQEILYGIVGERVRFSREAIGLSQAKLAKRLGMSRTSVVNIEAGRQHPPLHVLWGIAEALDSPLESLIPSASEYQQSLAPLNIDSKVVSHIEEAANGDMATRRDLLRFIAKTQAKTRGNE